VIWKIILVKVDLRVNNAIFIRTENLRLKEEIGGKVGIIGGGNRDTS